MKAIFFIALISTIFIYGRWYNSSNTKSMESISVYDGKSITPAGNKILDIPSATSLLFRTELPKHKNEIINVQVPVVNTYEKSWGIKSLIKSDTLWDKPLYELKYVDPSCGCKLN